MIEKALYICSARSMIVKEMFVIFNITYEMFSIRKIFYTLLVKQSHHPGNFGVVRVKPMA